MSAIGGIASFSNDKVLRSSLENLCNTMKNRGSDTQNIWHTDYIGMVHKQLWTTSESQHENQPLADSTENFFLTADARIDNRDELIPLLCEHLKNIAIITDADIILASYLQWQEQCVDYLIGDFAFALWDKKEEKLFCARDHLGIKPFNYIYADDGFYFSSEIRALFNASCIEPKLNILETQHFMQSYKITRDTTFFDQAKRLVPGHTLIIHEKELTIQRYWFPESITIDKSITLEEAKTKFYDLMEEATRVRLRSAYEVGCEISGGLDSSTILALALKHNPDVIPFASTYGDLDCDESKYIQSITEGLDVTPVINQADKLDYKDSNSLKKYYAKTSDWPGMCSFLDSANEFKNAKKHNVRVVLTGQGGDHVAAGNPYRLTDYLCSGAFAKLYSEHKVNPFNFGIVKSYFISPFLPGWAKKIGRILIGKSKNNSTFAPIPYYLLSDKKRTQNSYSQLRDLDLICGDRNLLWMDNNPYNTIGGRFDIEARHPFFDKRVVEFMLSISPWLKSDQESFKIVLRESMRSLLPKLIHKREGKVEFSSIIQLQLLQSLDQNQHPIINFNNKSVTLNRVVYNSSKDINDIWMEICVAKWIKFNNLI